MFLGKTVYHYNRLMVTHIGMKLSTHTYYITPMTLKATTYNRQPQAVFFKITSSLLKLANYSAHRDETLCAGVFHCFHDNHQQKNALRNFSL